MTLVGVAFRHESRLPVVPWSNVRGFGSVKYFNVSYGVLFAVPILHELYAKSVPLMEWLGAPGPFPTTVRWLYGASLSYAIAIALYQWFCPPEIKRFGGNKDEYLLAQYDSYQRALPNHRLNIVLANLDRALDADVYQSLTRLLSLRDASVGQERVRIQREMDEVIERAHPDAVQRYLLNEYERLNNSQAMARIASFILYLLGTAILFALLAGRSYSVLWA
jgi:hypothetical protein